MKYNNSKADCLAKLLEKSSEFNQYERLFRDHNVTHLADRYKAIQRGLQIAIDFLDGSIDATVSINGV